MSNNFIDDHDGASAIRVNHANSEDTINDAAIFKFEFEKCREKGVKAEYNYNILSSTVCSN